MNNMAKPWLRRFSDIDDFCLNTDVIIVGYGGGSTQMSSCEMYLGGSGGTALHKPLGIEDSTENMIVYLSEALGPHGDSEKTRLYAETEAQAGLPEGSLQATVSDYNRYADKKEEPLFQKHEDGLKPINKPPFAVISYHPQQVKYALGEDTGYLMFTLGGLETLASGEALNSFGDTTFFGRRVGLGAAANKE